MAPRFRPFRFMQSLAAVLAARPQTPPGLEDNALLRVILQRRSVRKFSDRPIPGACFEAVLEAGRLAPSTVNLQTWSFIPFDAAEWHTTFNHPLPFKGSRAVLILADSHRLRAFAPDLLPEAPLVEHTVAVMNASLAAMNMNIAAEALGISSVMLSETGRTGLLDVIYLSEKLGLPEGVLPLMTIVFGYAEGARPPMPPKLPLQSVCFAKTYQETERGVMESWLDQMKAGYKASHLFSSFDTQLKVYAAKLQQAEEALHLLVARKGEPAPRE